MSRSPQQRLGDVLDAIRKIRDADTRLQQAHALGDLELAEIAFDAVLMNLVVIGESLKALPAATLEREPTIPWRDVARMRDTIGHHYHRIDPAIVHSAVGRDLPALAAAVVRLMASVDDDE